MRAMVAAVAAMLALAGAVMVMADGNNCRGTENTYPVWSGSPVFVRNNSHASLYTATDSFGRQLRILHMSGTPYEMGFAHGSLLKDDIHALFPAFFQYIEDMVYEYIKFLPKDIADIIERLGVDAALDFTADLTRSNTPESFFQEIQGLADGAGIAYKEMLRLQMFPELIKAQCSLLGAWGPATIQGSAAGGLVQLRALDWDTVTPLIHYHQLNVYHPSSGQGHAFASLSWSGFIGSITGFSDQLAICEKVWLGANQTSSRAGQPFHFLLRDILQYDITIDDAINRMANAERTCQIYVGVGERRLGQFRAFAYAHESLNTYDDINYPFYTPAHPQMDGVVFVDKHVQPSGDPCMGTLLSDKYGSIDALFMKDLVSQFQTGDHHLAVYDWVSNSILISVASPDLRNSSATAPAYNQPFWRLSMGDLLSVVV
jgi:hypothetical protein